MELTASFHCASAVTELPVLSQMRRRQCEHFPLAKLLATEFSSAWLNCYFLAHPLSPSFLSFPKPCVLETLTSESFLSSSFMQETQGCGLLPCAVGRKVRMKMQRRQSNTLGMYLSFPQTTQFGLSAQGWHKTWDVIGNFPASRTHHERGHWASKVPTLCAQMFNSALLF